MIDNGVMAIISTIMIGLGFINGYAFGALFYSTDRIHKLEEKLQEAIDDKFKADKEYDELKESYIDLLNSYNEHLGVVNKLQNIQIHNPLKTVYPKVPNTPLIRSTNYIESDSDDETLSSVLPTTPCSLDKTD